MTFLSSAVIPPLLALSAVAAIAIVVRSPTLSMKGPYPPVAPDSAVGAGAFTYGNIAVKTHQIRLLALAQQSLGRTLPFGIGHSKECCVAQRH
jgi:hypothetical protein